jgi:HPt (histidine-containing phosphotransfer) domain-containing protein
VGASSVANAIVADEWPTVIDEEHLRRMTLGDRSLEREILQIFVRQAMLMTGRIAQADAAIAAAAAHTLLGSARGIGAWRVAQAAERLEHLAGQGKSANLAAAVAELKAAVVEASAAIEAQFGVAPGEPARGC